MMDSITGTISMSRRKGGVFHHPDSVRLHFGNDGILDDWGYKGHYNAFDHPFKTLRCE